MKNTSKILALVLVVMTVLMSLSVLTANAAAGQTWTVAGTSSLCGSNWSTGDTNNDMSYDSATDTYYKVYYNVPAGTHKFKCAKDHAWTTAYPSSDYVLTITAAEAGYTVTIKLKGNSVTVTKEAPTCDHDFSGGNVCLESVKCSKCDVTSGAPSDHVYGSDKVCDLCGFDNAKSHTVYFINTGKWSSVNAHNWSKVGGGTTWPGTKATKVADNIYAYTTTAGWDMIIFNGGGAQTTDLLVPGDNMVYDFSTGKWSAHEHAYSEGSCTEAPTCYCGETQGEAPGHNYVEGTCTECGGSDPDYCAHANMSLIDSATCLEGGQKYYDCDNCDYTTEPEASEALGHDYVNGVCSRCNLRIVYFVNTSKWTSVYAYMWNANGNNSWPGAAMKKLADVKVNGFDVYYIESEMTYTSIIFNNNTGTQTSDLTYTVGQYYYEDEWYASVEDIPEKDPCETDNYLAGSFNEWNATANQFKLDNIDGTVSYVRINLAKNTSYQFKVVISGTWTGFDGLTLKTSDGTAGKFTKITEGDGYDNIAFTTECAGEYVFALEGKTLTVTFVPHEIVADAAVDATCTETGLTAGEHCTKCDYVKAQEEVPALGHDKVVDVEAKAPTCTEAGNTEGSYCSRCDAETVVSETLPATGHDDNFIALGVCTKCYAFNYWLVGDNAITVTESHPLTTAGNPVPYEFRYIYITEAGHYVFYAGSEYTPATIFTTPVGADGKVDTSKYSFNIAWLEPGVYWVGVNFYLGVGEYTLNVSKVDCTTKEVTVDPTCTAEGSYVKYCELCAHVFEQKVLPAAGHTEVVDAAKDATCTETGLTEGKHCSVCNEVLVAQEEVPSLRHDWSEGNECSRCGTPKCVHEWVDTVVDPTCVNDGYTLHTCSKCGENYKDTTVSATGSHTWVETVVAPTCTEAGSKTNTCSVCEETKTEEIPALGHTFANGYCVCGAAEFVPGVHVLNVDATLAGGYKNTVVRISEAGMYRIYSNSIAIIWIYTTELSTSNPEDWPADPNQGNWLIRSETGYAYLEPGDYIFGIYCLGIVPVGEYTLTIEAHTEHTFVEGKCACGEEDPTYVPDEPGTEDPGQQPGDDKPGDDKPGDEPTTPAPELTLWDKIVAFLKKILDMILGFFKK